VYIARVTDELCEVSSPRFGRLRNPLYNDATIHTDAARRADPLKPSD